MMAEQQQGQGRGGRAGGGGSSRDHMRVCALYSVAPACVACEIEDTIAPVCAAVVSPGLRWHQTLL
jgi:hypothetical protein